MTASEFYDELSIQEGWVVFGIFIPKRPFKWITIPLRELFKWLTTPLTELFK